MQGGIIACFGQKFEADTGGSLPLGPPVLVPGLHLGVGQVQLGCKLLPVLHREILLFLETSLQSLKLVVGEGCSCFSLLTSQGALS